MFNSFNFQNKKFSKLNIIFDKMSGFVYLIKIYPYNENIYKIGKTEKLEKMMAQYKSQRPKIILYTEVNNMLTVEKYLIYVFRNKFEKISEIGNKYFRGNENKIKNIIFKCLYIIQKNNKECQDDSEFKDDDDSECQDGESEFQDDYSEFQDYESEYKDNESKFQDDESEFQDDDESEYQDDNSEYQESDSEYERDDVTEHINLFIIAIILILLITILFKGNPDIKINLIIILKILFIIKFLKTLTSCILKYYKIWKNQYQLIF